MNTLTLLRMYIILRQLRQHDRWSRQRLEAYQRQLLDELRAYTYQHSRFYQQFHNGLFDRPLQDLPVLTKNRVMESFDELVTDRAVHIDEVRRMQGKESLYLGHYRVNVTSGSSGVPGVFLFGEGEWAAIMASYARGQQWGGIEIGLLHSHKFAFVLSPMPQHMSYRVSRTMRSPWARMLHLSATEPLESIVQQLNDWQPEVLGTYASMARFLAVEQIAGRLHIQPHQIFSSADVLTDETRNLIVQAWGQQPHNEYAATETAVIAAECEYGRLHVSEDLLIVENVDDLNNPVPPGEFGSKLLVTVLFNRTQPLIRYQLHDSVKMSSEACECGRPYTCIERIQGRLEEILHLPTRSGEVIAVPPLAFHQVMDAISAGSWQIVHRDDGLHILLAGREGGESDSAVAQSLWRMLERLGVEKPAIQIEHVQTIPRSAGGKLLLIKSEVTGHQKSSLYSL